MARHSSARGSRGLVLTAGKLHREKCHVYSVLLKVPLSPYTGYGNDGIGLARHFSRMGLDVYLAPSVVQSPLPADVAMLLTKSKDSTFDFLIHHVSPDNLGLLPQEARLAEVTAAWTMWEWPHFVSADDSFTKVQPEHKDSRSWQDKMGDYDVVMCYDRTTIGALSENTDGHFEVLQGGYDPAQWTETWRPEGGPFVFSMAGQLHNRKNPFAAVKAFKALKDELGPRFDAELHLKTTIPSLHPQMEEWCPGLKIHYKSWNQEEMRAFYAMTDVYVGPSWGEGKNLPALEAGTCGAAIMVSDTGGHQMWMREEFGWLTPGGTQVVDDDREAFIVDVDVLCNQMLQAYENKAETRRRGQAAAAALPNEMSWAKKCEDVVRLLEKTPQSRVETLLPR